MYTTPEQSSIPSLKDVMRGRSFEEYCTEATFLDTLLTSLPVDLNAIHDDTDCYLIPAARAHLIFLDKLLAPLLSDSMLEDECVQTLADSLYQSMQQAAYELHAQPFISIYEVTQEYGGPEEGGWYFDNWVLESTRSIPYDEVSDYLTQLLEDYDSMEDNAATSLLDHAALWQGYKAFLMSTQQSIDNYRALNYTTIGDFASHPNATYEYVIWQSASSQHPYTEIYVVFEWTPGQQSTTHKPLVL